MTHYDTAGDAAGPVPAEITRRHGRAPARIAMVFLLLLAGLHLGANLGEPEHHKRAEVRPPICAREMLASGNFIVPTLGGHKRFEKPPLQYWLIALTAELFSGGEVTRFASRVPSLIAGLLVLFLTWLWCRRLAGNEHWYGGLFAPLLLLAAPSFFTLARSSQAEMWLCAFILLSTYLFQRAAEDEKARNRYLLLAYLSLAGGMLAKGPIALFMAVLPYLAMQRLAVLREWRVHLAGLLVSALPVGAWGVACYISDPEAVRIFLKEMYTQQFGSHAGHHHPMYYYLRVMGEDFSVFLPFIVPAAAAAFRGGGGRRFACLFFLLNLAWLTLMPAKQSHYFLPVLPVMAVLLGLWLEARARDPRLERYTRWIGVSMLGVFGLAGMVLLPETLPWLAVVLLAAGVLHFLRHRIPLPGLFAFVVALATAGHLRELYIHTSAFNLNERKLTAAWTLNQGIPPGETVHVEPQDPLFVYYWGRPIEETALSTVLAKKKDGKTPLFRWILAHVDYQMIHLLKQKPLLPLKVIWKEKEDRTKFEYALFEQADRKRQETYRYRVLIVPERSEEVFLSSPRTMLPGIDTYHAFLPEQNPFDGFSFFTFARAGRRFRAYRPHLEQGVELWVTADTASTPFRKLWFHEVDLWGVTRKPLFERDFFHGRSRLFVLDAGERGEEGLALLKERIARPGATLRLVFVEHKEGEGPFLAKVRPVVEQGDGVLLNDLLAGERYAAATLEIGPGEGALVLLDDRGRTGVTQRLAPPGSAKEK